MTDRDGANGVAGRVLSIDIFRGATIIAMVFANSTTKMGLPWWMEHAGHTEGKTDLITWVDMIFPAFMFIMGLAVPLAMGRRLETSSSVLGLVGHVVGGCHGVEHREVVRVDDLGPAGSPEGLHGFGQFVQYQRPLSPLGSEERREATDGCLQVVPFVE